MTPPRRFRATEPHHGRRWCQDFFRWYSDEHHHEGLELLTPADVFFGRAEQIAERRQTATTRAYAAHPERFVRGLPLSQLPPESVTINPIEPETPSITADGFVNARDAELASLWAPALRPSTTPVIHIPGSHVASPGVAPNQPFTT